LSELEIYIWNYTIYIFIYFLYFAPAFYISDVSNIGRRLLFLAARSGTAKAG